MKWATGLAAGLVGGAVMNGYVRAAAHLTGNREARDAAPGPHRAGRGVQPPQAVGRAENDAATRSVRLIVQRIFHRDVPPRLRIPLGTAGHYALSAALGVTYVLLRRRAPIVGAGSGAAFGAAVWLAADEGVVPLLGLSRGPGETSAALKAYGLAGHCVFGIALHLAARTLDPSA